jgi:hypothetical protein
MYPSTPSQRDCGTSVQDTPTSTLLPAPVLQTPAIRIKIQSFLDTSSEDCDGNYVAVQRIPSSDALSFGSSEHEEASSEVPPRPNSVKAISTRRQLAKLTEFYKCSSRG